MRALAWTACAALGVVGCGDLKETTDAAPPADADLTDADLTGMATVITESELFGGVIGANVPNIDVISMLPNNTVHDMVKTDSNGTATIKVYPGGSITAVYPHTLDMGADLITYVGVKPGDSLHFGSRRPLNANVMATPITQTVSYPAVAGVSYYEVATACGGYYVGTATSFAITDYNYCHTEPSDIAFYAVNTAGDVISYGYRSNITFSGTTVSLSGWSPAQTATVNVSGLPAEFTGLSGQWGTVIDPSSPEIAITGFNGTPTGGAFTATFPYATTGDRTLSTISLGRPGFGSVRILDSFSAGTKTPTVAAPTFPPLQQSSAIASAALRSANWFFVPSSSSMADAVVGRASWSRTMGTMSSAFQWYFIMPPGAQGLVFPKLPSQFDDNMPAPSESLSFQVRTFDSNAFSNYDSVRAMPSRNVMCLECALRGGDISHVVSAGSIVN